MRAILVPLALLLSAWVPAVFAQVPPNEGEVIAAIRIHGNHATPDAEIVALSGLSVGERLETRTLAAAVQRLKATGRFDRVEVRKRFPSMTEADRVVVVLIVSEPARGSDGLPVVLTPARRLRESLMFLPVLSYADGYGFTYGGRATFADVLGRKSRVTTPLTWGGVRRAAVEAEKRFERGPVDRLLGVLSISQRENPHYRLDDRRNELSVRAERDLWAGLRAGGGVSWADVSFGALASGGVRAAFDLDERFVTWSADVTFDTRVDPAFPRNAVYARTGWEALRFPAGETVQRVETEARGYIGLIGQSVLSVRALYGRASAPLPPYEQWLLGGASTLRGYRAGTAAGDAILASSAEVRVPLTTPLKLGKSGFTVFVDSGTVAAHGERLRDRRMHSGAGVGLFFVSPVFQLNIDVAKGFDAGPRVHLMTGFSF